MTIETNSGSGHLWVPGSVLQQPHLSFIFSPLPITSKAGKWEFHRFSLTARKCVLGFLFFAISHAHARTRSQVKPLWKMHYTPYKAASLQ